MENEEINTLENISEEEVKYNLILETIENTDFLIISSSELQEYNKYNNKNDYEKKIRETIINKLCSVIFGDNYEFQYGIITTHFPEVNVENESGNIYTIYNLFVRLGFDTNYLFSSRYFKGAKTTFDLKDFSADAYNSVYTHSHLPPIELETEEEEDEVSYYTHSLIYFDDFCTGDSVLNDNLDTLRLSGWDAVVLRKILCDILSYIPWESKSGGPYRYFEDLKYPTLNNASNSDDFYAFYYQEKKLFNLLSNESFIEDLSQLPLLNSFENIDVLNSFIFQVDIRSLKKVLIKHLPHKLLRPCDLAGNILNGIVDVKTCNDLRYTI